MNDPLHAALAVAIQAHSGQMDKQGEPYLFHVMRVALSLDSKTAQIVALLHDVVEDGGFTLEELGLDFPPIIVEAVDALTQRKEEGETYADYIERVALDEMAVYVKMADLRDHLRPERISALPEPERSTLSRRYHDAYQRLLRS